MPKPSKKRYVPAGEKNPLRVACDFVELVAMVSKGAPGESQAIGLILDCCIGPLKGRKQLERLAQVGLALHDKAESKLQQLAEPREAQSIPFPSKETVH